MQSGESSNTPTGQERCGVSCQSRPWWRFTCSVLTATPVVLDVNPHFLLLYFKFLFTLRWCWFRDHFPWPPTHPHIASCLTVKANQVVRPDLRGTRKRSFLSLGIKQWPGGADLWESYHSQSWSETEQKNPISWREFLCLFLRQSLTM